MLVFNKKNLRCKDRICWELWERWGGFIWGWVLFGVFLGRLFLKIRTIPWIFDNLRKDYEVLSAINYST